MAHNNSILQSVKLYKLGINSLWLSIVHHKQWNKYLLDITQKLTYTKDGKTKDSYCSTYLYLIAANALVNQLLLVYQLSKNLQNKTGVYIYNTFCLICKICYLFLHNSATSYRERLGKKWARWHCRSRRNSSLKYRQLCPKQMQTYSRLSRSARI